MITMFLLFPIVHAEQNVKLSVTFKPKVNLYKKYIDNQNVSLSFYENEYGAMTDRTWKYKENKKESEIFKPEIAKADVAIDASLPISEKMKFKGQILLPLDDKSNFLKKQKVQLTGQIEYNMNPYKLTIGMSNNSRMSGLGSEQKPYIRGSDVFDDSLPGIYEKQIGYDAFKGKIFTRIENEEKLLGIAYHYDSNSDVEINKFEDIDITKQEKGLLKGKLPYKHDMIEFSTKYTTDIGENSVFSISGGYNIGVKYKILTDAKLLGELYNISDTFSREKEYFAPLAQIKSDGLKIRRLKTFDIGTKLKYKNFELALAYMYLGKSNKLDHKFDDIILYEHIDDIYDTADIHYQYDIEKCTNNLYEIGTSISLYNYKLGAALLYGNNDSGFTVDKTMQKDKIVSLLYSGDYKINDNVLFSVSAKHDRITNKSKIYSKNLDRILFADVNLTDDNIAEEKTWTLSAAVKIKV